ncbi:MAG: AAA family ATPase, partial [Jatrophihabitans endophyticus]
AIAAALGPAADAVAVGSLADADAGLAHLKAEDAGRASFVVATDDAGAPDTDVPAGTHLATSLVEAPADFAPAVTRLLRGVVVVDDASQVAARLDDAAVRRVVTRDGDVYSRELVQGGSSTAPSAIEITAAVEEAHQKADEAARRHDRAHAELSEATTEAARRRADVESALEELHESDAKLSAVAEQLAQLGQVARSAAAEAARMDDARAALDEAHDRDLAGLAELEERLELAQATADEPGEPDTAARDALQGSVGEARQGEMEARLAVRTGEERVRAVSGRADQLLRAAEIERAARLRRRQAREARARGAVVAAAVRDASARVLDQLAGSVAEAATWRDETAQARAEREREQAGVRGRVRELAEELTRLTDAVHRDEVVRAEQRLRIEQIEDRAVEEFGVEVEALVAEYGPDQPCPPSAAETAEYEQARERGEQVVAPAPGPYDRSTQEKRATRAERDLALLGKVNPLALEEFAALEERHQFLSTQLEDLKATRRDLLTVVKEVDDRILEVFTSAYTDVAREFEIVFATLFPGGEGRLVLTEPDDMLLTGIDVEARPPGKKVKRLSLLSGGERSLVAVALLVAIFRARPSPFYVMDEIEAALDDTNLGRLLDLIGQLRASSQIIQITHQKRTMEIADALYGVTMRGDGVTQVISQRLREAV